MVHNIILNDGDTITESAIRTLLGRAAVSGYVETGLGIAYYDDDTADVAAGVVHILDGSQDITVETDAFTGVGLAGGSVNHLWVTVDPSAADDDAAVSIATNTTGVAPSTPSLKIGTVDASQSGDAAVTELNRSAEAEISEPEVLAAIDGAAIDPQSIGSETPAESITSEGPVSGASGAFDALEVAGGAPHMGVEDHIIAVAPGDGYEAIPTSNDTPVQDAIDAIDRISNVTDTDRYKWADGAGTVILPPELVTEAATITNAANKTIVGAGTMASRLRFPDGVDGFDVAGLSNSNHLHLTDFAIEGGAAMSDRTSGSAIIADSDRTTSRAFTIGRLLFRHWGGTDPVILLQQSDPFSCRWSFIRGMECAGSLIDARSLFDVNIGTISTNTTTPDIPVIDIGYVGSVRIGSLNIGGPVGKALIADSAYSQFANFELGALNAEPGVDQGTSPPFTVALRGASQGIVGSITTGNRTTPTNIVRIEGSQRFSSSNNDKGSAKRIGSLRTTGNSTGAPITVIDGAYTANWYWGPESDIERNDAARKALIPMADMLFASNGERDPGIVATLSANETVPTQTQAPLSLDTQELDTGTATPASSLDTSTGEITVNEAGVYDIEAQATIDSPEDGRLQLRVSDSGGIIAYPEKALESGGRDSLRGGIAKRFAAGETLTFDIWHGNASGSDKDIVAGANKTYLAVRKVAH